MSEVILRTVDLTKTFGGLIAVDKVNFSVKHGKIHAIIGPNGAGKTTLFNLITGVLKPSSGKVYFEDKDITGKPPHYINSLGLTRSFQVYSIFPNLTVLENIRLAVQGSRPKIKWDFLHSTYFYKDIVWEAMRIASLTGLYGKTNLLARDLTPGDKRKLEIAMALAGNPKLVALDEPTAGVSLEDVPSIVRLIKRLRDEMGKTVLVVEHKIDVILETADVVSVMDHGRIIAEGSPQEIMENREVQRIYLGE
ncbi:MAG: ABC transporter ATP-binding protein [Infirmifilum uzonense]|uniref:ABC transporter ATP-binding protein n=1 Tax=Infirmifilum uzonense TaxID=1550241 RepID=UPI003C73681C